MSAKRIAGLLLRHLYLYRRSLTRMLEVAYWPVMDLLVWGFVSLYIAQVPAKLPPVIGFFLGAMIFWDIFYRAQQAIAISFLEDVWARNLINLFITPLSVGEFLTATMILGILKVTVTSLLLVVLALSLYHFNLFHLGLSLIPLVANLILTGWWVGILTTGLILRFGQGAESLAWALAFLFQPFSAVFYPLSVLPPLVQVVGWYLPTTHVFEGMRQIIAGGGLSWAHLAWATGLNVIYLFAAMGIFQWAMAVARRLGLLLRVEG
ncbi:MAG: ABC transporter permease [Armatimonadota bacterium]|nr:ABC transporter permease [Armatimonadota bacterium]MDR5704174.1 ABC transporter permease [Armatimonadota bacterium]MDR7435120.1 ABC transporter permease [Armatimonadota bacterium]